MLIQNTRGEGFCSCHRVRRSLLALSGVVLVAALYFILTYPTI